MDVASIISIISVVITSIIGPVCLVLVNHKIKKGEQQEERRQQDEERLREELRRERREEITQIVSNVIENKTKCLVEDVSEIKESLAINTTGTVTLLRDRMKCSLNYCRNQGYATTTDKANWNELYNTYKSLGGNHFREYVDAWKDEMNSLPSEKPKPKRTYTKRKSSTKKVLVEDR